MKTFIITFTPEQYVDVIKLVTPNYIQQQPTLITCKAHWLIWNKSLMCTINTAKRYIICSLLKAASLQAE